MVVKVNIKLDDLISLLESAFDRGSDFEVNEGQYLLDPEERQKAGNKAVTDTVIECFAICGLDLNSLIKQQNENDNETSKES